MASTVIRLDDRRSTSSLDAVAWRRVVSEVDAAVDKEVRAGRPLATGKIVAEIMAAHGDVDAPEIVRWCAQRTVGRLARAAIRRASKFFNKEKDMREDGWDVAGAVEHAAEVKKVRAMIEETRAGMPNDKRAFEGLVLKEVNDRHAAEISGDPAMLRALASWALLHLCEEAEDADEMIAESPH